MSKIYIAKVPNVSTEFAKDLNNRFRPLSIKHTTTIEEIMYNAGQRSVVDFVKANASSGTVVSGNPEDLRQEDTKPSLLAKILGW